jgi:hypothetical protein
MEVQGGALVVEQTSFLVETDPMACLLVRGQKAWVVVTARSKLLAWKWAVQWLGTYTTPTPRISQLPQTTNDPVHLPLPTWAKSGHVLSEDILLLRPGRLSQNALGNILFAMKNHPTSSVPLVPLVPPVQTLQILEPLQILTERQQPTPEKIRSQLQRPLKEQVSSPKQLCQDPVVHQQQQQQRDEPGVVFLGYDVVLLATPRCGLVARKRHSSAKLDTQRQQQLKALVHKYTTVGWLAISPERVEWGRHLQAISLGWLRTAAYIFGGRLKKMSCSLMPTHARRHQSAATVSTSPKKRPKATNKGTTGRVGAQSLRFGIGALGTISATHIRKVSSLQRLHEKIIKEARRSARRLQKQRAKTGLTASTVARRGKGKGWTKSKAKQTKATGLENPVATQQPVVHNSLATVVDASASVISTEQKAKVGQSCQLHGIDFFFYAPPPAQANPTTNLLTRPVRPVTADGVGVRYVHGLAHRDWILHLGEHYRIESQLQEVFLDMHIFDTVNSWKLLQAEGLFVWTFLLTQGGEINGVEVQVQSDGWVSMQGCPVRHRAAAQYFLMQLLFNPATCRSLQSSALPVGISPELSSYSSLSSSSSVSSSVRQDSLGRSPVFPTLEGIHNPQNLPLPGMTSLVANWHSPDLLEAEEGVDFWSGVGEFTMVSPHVLNLVRQLIP